MNVTQPAKAPVEEISAENLHGYRVLIVDDNEASAKTLMWTMEMLGHSAKIAFDGPNAIALAKSFLPDIALLDIGIPGMNGYEICRAMRQESSLQNTVFIAQTGWGQKEHRERSKEAGFAYHLVKPLNIEAIENILLLINKK